MRTIRIGAVCVVLLLSLLPALGAQAGGNGALHGSQVSATAGTAETVARLKVDQRQTPRAAAAPTTSVRARVFTGVNPRISAERKVAARSGAGAPVAIGSAAPVPARRVTPPTTAEFDGLTFNDACAAGSCVTPPDGSLAASTNWVLQGVNGVWRVTDTTGHVQPGWPKSDRSFFDVPDPTPVGCDQGQPAYLTDPRAFYDPNDQRFWALILQDEGTPLDREPCDLTARMWIAVSATSDPRGTWHVYAFDMTLGKPYGVDFPGFGFDSRAIYFSGNMFDRKFNTTYAEVFAASKAKMEQGQSVTALGFSDLQAKGVRVDTVQPVLTEVSGAGPKTEYLVNSFNLNSGGGQCLNGCTGIVVWAFSNPIAHETGGPLPQLTGVVVATKKYGLSPNANQPGCTYCVETLDTRLGSIPAFRSGSIVTGLTTALTNGTTVVPGVLWFQLRPVLAAGTVTCPLCTSITSASVQQSAYFLYAGDQAAMYPTFMPGTNGSVTMILDISSHSRFPSGAYYTRLATDPAGSFPGGGQLLGDGTVSTADDRWGDYTAASFSGFTSNRIWMMTQYSPADHWGTRIGSFVSS